MPLGHQVEYDRSLYVCKCAECYHDAGVTCVYDDCACCSLEDQFSLLTQIDFDPKSDSNTRNIMIGSSR
jgi:hypothetical protein